MANETSLQKTLSKSLEVKSLKDLVRVRTSEHGVLMIDTSGSMTDTMRNGKQRIQGLREVVIGLQKARPTPMIAFGYAGGGGSGHPLEQGLGSQEVGMVTEVPEALGGRTPLTEAIDFARTCGFSKGVVISDGGPDNRSSAMEAARRFGGQIDVIFVGDEGDPGSVFLEELAKMTGGVRFQGDLSDVKELTGAVIGLLNGEVLEQTDEDDDDEDGDEEDDEDEDD